MSSKKRAVGGFKIGSGHTLSESLRAALAWPSYRFGINIKREVEPSMPRKSAASLSVVPRVPGKGRPEPPADLDALESRIWREVVDALPGHWLDSAGQLVLRRLAAQAAVSERLEARLRQLRAQDEDDDGEAAILASQHGVMAKNVVYLLTQLRATPRTQLRSRTAGSRAEQAPEARPWEIRAGA
jgi:hypothetical protein